MVATSELIEQRIIEWLSRLKCEATSSVLAPRSYGFTLDRQEAAALSAADVRKSLMASFPYEGAWRERGIYVWYWPPMAGAGAWPLYVGKVYGATRNFRVRTGEHLAHAVSGKDSLYCPSLSRRESRLIPIHGAGVSIGPRHAESMVRQFSAMRILLLPLPKSDAVGLAGAAESLVLCAAHKLNSRQFLTDSVESRDADLWVMNTSRMVGSPDWIHNLTDEVAGALIKWME